EVSVAHASGASAALGRDAVGLEPAAERERLVVRGRHDDREEGLAGVMDAVEVTERVVEEVLVADAPDIREAHAVDRAPVDDVEAVVAEERIHVVEVAVSTVQEARL